MNARFERLAAFLARVQPDIVCLQELKASAENYPLAAVTALGYESHIFGQKTYNGVAVLARHPVQFLAKGIGDAGDPEARMIAVTTSLPDGTPLTVVSLYVPNGRSIEDPEYKRKLGWIDRCSAVLAELKRKTPGVMLVCGDFNVAPEDRDVHDPAAWLGQVLCSGPERQALAELTGNLGLVDLHRALEPDLNSFTWWDYRNLSFPKNRGLRIDLIFVEPVLLPRCSRVWVERVERKGLKPSDHAPVCAEFV